MFTAVLVPKTVTGLKVALEMHDLKPSLLAPVTSVQPTISVRNNTALRARAWVEEVRGGTGVCIHAIVVNIANAFQSIDAGHRGGKRPARSHRRHATLRGRCRPAGAKTLPLPCVSTAFVAKRQHLFLAVHQVDITAGTLRYTIAHEFSERLPNRLRRPATGSAEPLSQPFVRGAGNIANGRFRCLSMCVHCLFTAVHRVSTGLLGGVSGWGNGRAGWFG